MEMTHKRQRYRSAASDPAREHARSNAARKWAWLLGFCLPLSGGLPISQWIPNYPDQLTLVRVVTLGTLMWLLSVPSRRSLPAPSRKLLLAYTIVAIYALASLFWTQSFTTGLHDFLTNGIALLTGIALMLVCRECGQALAAFARGVLVAGSMQVGLSVVELLTGFHVSNRFGAEYLTRWDLASVEIAFGSVAWGTMGNPNDLGGFLLLTLSIFLSASAWGVVMSPGWRLFGWVVAALAIFIGFTSLDDARAFRLGALLLLVLHLVDRLVPPRQVFLRAVAVLLLLGGGLAVAIAQGKLLLGSADHGGFLDEYRFSLLRKGVQVTVDTLGFGRGLGAEQAMINSGEIPLNFHNVTVKLAVELGLLVATAFTLYLVTTLLTWAFGSRGSAPDGSAASARASLALALLLYGSTSSAVLDSPAYWTFFACIGLLSVKVQRPGPTPTLQDHHKGVTFKKGRTSCMY